MAEIQSTSGSAREQAIIEYREIPGYPGFFAGTDGTIWSDWNRNGTGRMTDGRRNRLSPRRHSQGYLTVGVKEICGTYRVRYVHQLVLEAFVGQRPAGTVACHANDIQSDNRLLNLSWGTPSVNLSDRNRNKPEATPRGTKHWNKKLTVEQVRDIKSRFAAGSGPYQIANEVGINPATVYDITNGKTWKHV